MLADDFVRWPVRFLAFRGAVLGGQASTAETELLDGGVLHCATSVADAISALLLRSMSGRGVIVGSSRGHRVDASFLFHERMVDEDDRITIG